MGKSYVITSGKGGVGKTTFTANLGIALASLNKKVVVVEGDIGLNNLDVALYLEDKVIYDMSDVLNNKCALKKSLVEYNENLYLMPAVSITTSLITTMQFMSIIAELKENFDYVIIDCPAGIEDSFNRAVTGGDEAIVVTTPYIASIRDAYKVSRVLTTYNLHEVGLVINRMKGDCVIEKKMLDAKDIASAISLPLWGVIPEDDNISMQATINEISQKCGTVYSYNLIANLIVNGDKKIFDYKAEHMTFFKKIRGMLK